MESVIHSLIGVTSVVRAEKEMNIGVQIATGIMGTHWCRWSGRTWRRGWRAGRRRRSRPWCRSWSSGPSCTPSGLRLHMVIMQNILNIDNGCEKKKHMVRLVQAASHPAVKKVFIESPVLHSAMQFSSYIHYSSDADCVPSDRHIIN